MKPEEQETRETRPTENRKKPGRKPTQVIFNDHETGRRTTGKASGKTTRKTRTSGKAVSSVSCSRKSGRKPEDDISVSDPVQAASVPDNNQADISVSRVGKRGKDKTSRKKRIDRNINTIPGENSMFIMHDLKLYNLPKIDMEDPQAVQDRINEFFTICSDDDMKPSVASLALSFGISRFVLFDILNGRSGTVKNSESIHTLKAAYDMINSYYEHMMNNGKINPVAGIFLMKNNLGYRDTTDYIVTANQEKQLSLNDITYRANLLEE